MPRDDSDAKPVYPITQAELESYRQLERVCRRYGADLAAQRHSIIDCMGSPLAVEPGPLNVLSIRAETRFRTIDQDGNRRPVEIRRLVVYEVGDEDQAA